MKNLLLTITFLIGFSSIQAQEAGIDLTGDALFGSIRARQIGPAVMSGRISDIEGHPTDDKIIYVGTAGGGVWKSVDTGVTFRSIFDDYTQSIGAVAVAPSNPKTIYVGTGEPWVRNSVSVGTGIYKSVDEGTTWEFIGLPESEHISRILVHPDDENTVYVGVQGHLWGKNEERGVYKTTDGGATWEKILYVDEGTGCADMEMDASNPDILYAAFWEHQRWGYFFNSGGEGSALYKSYDGGATWEKIHNGFPEGILGRIGIASAPSQPETLYATIEAKENGGLYRSNDGGGSWELLNEDFSIKVRPFYFSRLVVDPNDPEILYKAGFNASSSKDGGNTFRDINSAVHSDIHDIWINPRNTNIVFLGTDGGVYRSWDGGFVFEMVKGLPVSQFYHISIDRAKPYNVYGGLQDNGSWFGPSASPNGIENRDWVNVGGGDGFRTYVHPTNPDWVYCEAQGGALWRYNRKNYERKTIRPYPETDDEKLRFNWNTAINLSAQPEKNPNRIYCGTQFLFRSDDMGDSWTRISPDLTTNDPEKLKQDESGGLSRDNSAAENHCTIFAIAESPLDDELVWVGTDDGNLQVTTNGGGSWENVVKNVPELPANTWVRFVEPSHFDKNTAYVVFDGHTQNDKTIYAYKTTDLGQTWTRIATPEQIPTFSRCIREDFENPNLLFLGTENGLYVTIDGGIHWSQFTNNMPNAMIHYMEIQPDENDLVIGTHGRGIVIIDDITPLRQLTNDIIDEPVVFFETGPFYIREGAGFQDFNGAGEYVGENANSTHITYYLAKRHTFGKMTLEVLNDKDEKIADLIPSKGKGINRVDWDIQFERPKTAKGKTLARAAFATLTLPEGEYKIKMTKGKEVHEMMVTLAADPNTPHSAEERKLQHETALRLYDMTERLAYVVAMIDLMIEKADAGVESDPKLEKPANKLKEELNEFKATLVITTGDNYTDTAEDQLREKIANVYGEVATYPGKPSTSQLETTEVLDARLKEAESKLAAIQAEALSTFNDKLQKSEMDMIELQSFEDFLMTDTE